MRILERNRYIKGIWKAAAVLTVAVVVVCGFVRCNSNSDSSDKADEYGKLLSRPLDTLMRKGHDYFARELYDSAYLMYAAVAGRYSPSMSRADKYACERAFNNSGYLSHIYYYDYPQAYAQLLKALEITDEIQEASAYPYIYINIGNLMCATGNWSEGMGYQMKAMAAAMTTGDTVCYLKAAANIFSEALMEGKTGEYRAVVDSFPDVRGDDVLCRYTLKLRDVASAELRNDHNRVLALLESLKDDDESGLAPEERMKFFRLYIVARTEEHRREYRKAVEQLKAIERAGVSQPELETYLFEALSNNYKHLGLRDSAAIYKLKSAELTDTLRPVQKQATIYELKNAYENRAINFRMELLSRERTVLLRTIWIVVLFSLLVMALLVWVIISRRKTVRAKRELYARNQELLREIDSRRVKSPQPDITVAGNEPPAAVEQEEDTTVIDEDLLRRIQEIFESSEEIFTPDFSVEKMAAMLEVPVRRVSKTINDGLGQNFSTTLQTYRIREACRRLSDTAQYGNFTVEAIAESLGFKSRSNFNAVFKKKTGLTPAAWQKIARKEA